MADCIVCGVLLSGRQRKYCSLVCKSKKLDYINQKRRGHKRKVRLIRLAGGGCNRCGYNSHMIVLSFHHRDPESKSIEMRQTELRTLSSNQQLDELKKCELLCANCHMEVHHPHLAANIASQTLKSYVPNSDPESNGQCVSCGNVLRGAQRCFCSSQCKNMFHQNYQRQQIRGLERKLRLIELLGNQCSSCGYNKNLAALNFHHLEPAKKRFKLDLRSIANRAWDRLIEEVKLCELLCANCHIALHGEERLH